MEFKRLAAAVLPVVAAAGIGGYGSRSAPDVYARLRKPGWAPPAGVFGPVWSTLYVTIAAAGYRLPRRDRVTVALHLTQLGLNAAWPNAFFGRRDKRVSLGVIATLDAVLVAEMVRLRRTDPAAAALLLPYLGWSAFATALNSAVSDPQAS